MTGYLILIAIAALAFSHFFCFLAGLNKGRKKAEAEYNEEKLLREKDARMYEKAKQEIKQEVSRDAVEQKADLAKHTDARDRFNAINNSLSNSPKN